MSGRLGLVFMFDLVYVFIIVFVVCEVIRIRIIIIGVILLTGKEGLRGRIFVVRFFGGGFVNCYIYFRLFNLWVFL